MASKASKSESFWSASRPENDQGESFTEMVYRMLEEGEDDATIQKNTDAAFKGQDVGKSKRYLSQYKHRLSQLIVDGKRSTEGSQFEPYDLEPSKPKPKAKAKSKAKKKAA